MENYVIYRFLHRVNDNCYFAHSYTFARILSPGKRYDCAHCILLAAKLSVLGQATDLLNDN